MKHEQLVFEALSFTRIESTRSQMIGALSTGSSARDCSIG